MRKISATIVMACLSVVLLAQAANNAGYTESEVTLNTATGNLYGTLTVPDKANTSPLVLIIAGSGPTDRDCNSLMMGVQTNAYKMLAEELAKYGIASLRYDKRGVAKSMPAMISESELRFETYVNDVVDWITLLKADERFSSISLLGHSEGSLIGMIAAEKTDIAAFISVSGPGKPADKILEEQLKTKLPTELLEESNKILDSLRAGKTVQNVSPALTQLYRPGVQPYMISWMKYDPYKEMKKLTIPVLIIQGTTDLQVDVNNANLLSKANPNALLVIMDDMNHILKESVADAQTNMATYKNPELPLINGLTYAIVEFIKGQ